MFEGGDLDPEGAAVTILEQYQTRQDARRAWRRVPSRMPVRCRRLHRVETDVAVQSTVDVSPGGMQLRCGGLVTGDVVLCSLDGPDGTLGLLGRVVQTRPGPGGPPRVHIAWTDLSPAETVRLGVLIDLDDVSAVTPPPA
jgi:hypothetical protein